MAGSIAVNVVTSSTTSNAGTTDPVTVNGDVALTSRSSLTNNAIADAKQASDGSTSGVGASFALNVVNETTSAGLADNAVLTGAKNLTLTSSDTNTTTTTADGGASAGSGSIALSAQVAISLSNVTTSASIGSGPAASISGALTAHATQTAKVTTTAMGATKGGNAGVGLSLALTLANHLVDSQLKRDLTATGAVSFTADGLSSTDSEATASAKGAKGKGDDTSGKDVNGKSDDNVKDANDTSKSATGGKDSGTTNTPKAKSGENGGTSVEVAAAVAITISTTQSLAQLADNLSVTSGGALTLATSANSDATSKASGSAVDASSLNIGAAVAITLATVTNEAVVGTDTLVDSHGLSLAASMRNNAGDAKHSFDAEATSGAGKGKVGIAGSLALTIANVTTSAELKSNAIRGPPGDNFNASDVTLSAASSVSSTDKAMASDKDAGSVGIGAGAAINIVYDTTTASIDDGAVLTGAKNVTLSATDTDATTTYAEAGATESDGATLALAADAAIALPTVITSATIAGGTSQTLIATGAVSITATQTATATTTAKGDASTGDVVLGLALALAVPDDEVTATVSRTISATKVSLAANGSSDTETEADASAKGAEGADSGTKKDSSGKDVNGKADDQLSNANSESSTSTGKTSKTTDTSGAKAQTSDDNGSSSGDKNTVTVAGAVAINVVTTISQASLADTVVVTATAGPRA